MPDDDTDNGQHINQPNEDQPELTSLAADSLTKANRLLSPKGAQKNRHFLGRDSDVFALHIRTPMGAQQPRSNCTSRVENSASRGRGVITAAACVCVSVCACRVVSSKVMIKKQFKTQESPCNFAEA